MRWYGCLVLLRRPVVVREKQAWFSRALAAPARVGEAQSPQRVMSGLAVVWPRAVSPRARGPAAVVDDVDEVVVEGLVAFADLVGFQDLDAGAGAEEEQDSGLHAVVQCMG